MSPAAGKKALFTLAYNSENSVDFIKMIPINFKGFPGGSRGKEPSCQYRRHKRYELDPWVGKISWRRAWPRQCSCLENPMDRGAWQVTVHGVTKS